MLGPVRNYRKLSGKVKPAAKFLALDRVSFDICHGEVVGIIGPNGAGKSTLLKILSRITEPTSGTVAIDGRISSLLEVGTGFHPELTGRENIYLNAAILGMSRKEVNRKFDDIVSFAEVHKFIDTPVKRYSSGMQVRLAFSVAAHIEPEILLIDEVLAVGDVSFQNKCLGKMEGVAQQGNTILFVSHNMAAVKNICTRAILLDHGGMVFDGDVDEAVELYLEKGLTGQSAMVWEDEASPGFEHARLKKVYVASDKLEPTGVVAAKDEFHVIVEYEVLKIIDGMRTGFMMRNQEGVVICGSTDYETLDSRNQEPGVHRSICKFPGNVLNSGRYSLRFAMDIPPYLEMAFSTDYCISFDVIDLESSGPNHRRLPGVISPALEWATG